MKSVVLLSLVASASAFMIPPKMMVTALNVRGRGNSYVPYDSMGCDVVENNLVCASSPYKATKADVWGGQLTGATKYLGEYPAPGAGSRWSSATKLGANCEEEYVDGEVSWVCYIH